MNKTQFDRWLPRMAGSDESLEDGCDCEGEGTCRVCKESRTSYPLGAWFLGQITKNAAELKQQDHDNDPFADGF
jgi:hypothetical protein